MKALTPVDNDRTEAIESIFIGIIAVNHSNSPSTSAVKAGREVFKKIGSLTYKEFRNIKALVKLRTSNGR